MTKKTKTTEETIKVSGENLLKTVKGLIAQGNVRHITIKDKDGKTIIEFPLTIGVVGAVFLPVLAAVGAVAALIGECTISVDRIKE
ncbi:MAG: hypothetical protein UW41_C0022G0002 [Candidatus Collierbacteria bacterium GW2011_GWC2_44_18]|uniref:DUF4342 domain-containing protein n=1 Tax=Candidatus Collierbacteria bacterium GW2011_GWC2_44_18 TaxID=1618392 RepID=A0A0G1KL50_9BACT|nr:MAG: hypothetical protein UW41_C0022G0002 [Candidatus Collierbacteria bacterium GW2011_GWC2_44_18]